MCRHFSALTAGALRRAEELLSESARFANVREAYWQEELRSASRAVTQAERALQERESQQPVEVQGQWLTHACEEQRVALARTQVRSREVEAELRAVRHWKARLNEIIHDCEHRAAEIDETTGEVTARLQRVLWTRTTETRPPISEMPPAPAVPGLPVSSAQATATILLTSGSPTAFSFDGTAPLLIFSLLFEWPTIDQHIRRSALEELEQRVAAAQGRNPLPVVSAELAAGCSASFRRCDPVIALSRPRLQAAGPRSLMGDVLHQGRHAYQCHAVQHPGYHPDPAQTSAWMRNFDGYLDPGRVGLRRYRRQPVEADAIAFAGAVVASLLGDVHA